MNRAVFLDRDGTLIEDKHYLADPEEISWITGARQALKDLQSAGFKLVVVTNQSGVARGYFDEATVDRVHARFCSELREFGVRVDGLYYCPAHPEAETAKYRKNLGRRKPAPGMLHEAAEELKLELAESYMVGDKLSDVKAGEKAGCQKILVLTGKGQTSRKKLETSECAVDHVAADVAAAAAWIFEIENK